MNTHFKRICERKLRASDAREEKQLTKEERFNATAPPLLISLTEPIGELPPG
jgi:hypothetical protein